MRTASLDDYRPSFFRRAILSCVVFAAFAAQQRQHTCSICSNRRSVPSRAPVRAYATMETGQGSSTVTVSPSEILAGKEVQPSAPKAILRTDYRPTPYLVTDVHLTFLLGATTRVKSKLSFVPNYQGSPEALALDGESLVSPPFAALPFATLGCCRMLFVNTHYQLSALYAKALKLCTWHKQP